MRLLVKHQSVYRYPAGPGAALGPHLIRLKPAGHAKARVETYSLTVDPPGDVRWHQDPYGNHVARLTHEAGTRVPHLSIAVEFAVDVRPVNPFDFFVDDRCEETPFAYPKELTFDLAPFLERGDPALATGELFDAFDRELPRTGRTVPLVVELNRLVNRRVRYVIREEPGIFTPEECLREGRGSCRDSALLLIALLRARGLAARFVSGYLIQLTDEGMIPDEPKGVGRDVVDLHAWAEVFLPGAGWIGLDATSGLLCGEGHIPLAGTASPSLAAPIEGTSDTLASEASFEMAVGRLGHEVRPTTPYEESVWQDLLLAGERTDAKLKELGLVLTMGGEPTFNSRLHPDAPEWNGAALGGTKWTQGLKLVDELRERLSPGAATLHRMGKHYPGESLPRWAIDIVGRVDGVALWPKREPTAKPDAGRFARALAARLALPDFLLPAYEDPWRFVQDEESLPLDVDPLKADLSDPEERRRLARVLGRGLAAEAGYVLPVRRGAGGFTSEAWTFRRGRLFLLQGDSPIGLRLPLRSLTSVSPEPEPPEPVVTPADPRRADAAKAAEALQRKASKEGTATRPPGRGVRTALCVEERDGTLYVFLPPLPVADDFLALVAAVDQTRVETGMDVQLEGYPPASSPLLSRFAVTPDPGVLEVNLPVTRTARDYASLVDTVFSAGLAAGLHSEKYLLDGRMSGSGGGHHLTLGGPSALESPFVTRPDVLASLLTFVQHHPSLSYLFAGLFVGPTSQSPRVDEARHESLDELEIALKEAFERTDPPAWLSDLLFRHLLVDLTGNTHRTEISIDKLFDAQTAHGRQGLVELRAFEMPPHPRMAVAQMLLARSLVTAFADRPYRGRLARWGAGLHDRFLLPYFLWRDFQDVLAFLADRGLPLPEDGYSPFVELRCPLVGTLQVGDVTVEVRNALEPWNVLGEELTTTGTARYVDSSVERLEVRVRGMVPERHALLVNGHRLPLHPTKTAGEFVAGVRFRAWAPPHSLHAHLGIHHPVRFDVVDTWGRRSLGACAYHVWHPEGRAFAEPPLTRFEASARRAQRFTVEGPLRWPASREALAPHPETPYTLDLRRHPLDHPMPEPEEEPEE